VTDSARSVIGLLLSSRDISASKMFIATLRVEIVVDVIWSSELTFASCPKTKSPPTFGHLNGAAKAEVLPSASAKVIEAARPYEVHPVRAIGNSPLACCGAAGADWQIFVDACRRRQDNQAIF